MDEINIYLLCSNGDKFSFRLTTVGLNVADFKKSVAETFRLPAEELQLIHRGIIWQDDRTIDSYGVQAHHTIYVVPDPLLPLVKSLVDGDTELDKFRRILIDPRTHYDVSFDDVVNRICQASPPEIQLRLRLFDYMFENIEEQPFPNATTTSGGDGLLQLSQLKEIDA